MGAKIIKLKIIEQNSTEMRTNNKERRTYIIKK